MQDGVLDFRGGCTLLLFTFVEVCFLTKLGLSLGIEVNNLDLRQRGGEEEGLLNVFILLN